MKEFKVGDVIRITSKTSKHKNEIGFFMSYCNDSPDICRIKLRDGVAVNLKDTSFIIEAKAEPRAVSADDCINYIERHRMRLYTYQKQMLRALFSDGRRFFTYSYHDRYAVLRVLEDYIEYVYKGFELEPQITFSWEEAMAWN